MSPSEIRPSRGAGLVPAPRRADRGCVRDHQDFATVYDRWMPQLTRYCRGLTRSEADAEDAAQNAMLKAMAALERGPAPEQMQPWLHRIAHNEAISLMRRRGTVGAAVPTDVLPDRGGPSLEEVAAVRGRLQEMLGDLRALAPRQREALMLRELEGRSYREIAAELGVSEAAAQQTVLAARRSLQDCDAGRALACEPVQRWLSAHEHARVRTRRVRAHLRDCDGCRGFQAALRTRPRDLRLLFPGGAAAGLVGRLLALVGGPGSGVAAKAVVGAGVAATAAAGVLTVAPHAPRPAHPATPPRVVVASTPALVPARGATTTAPVRVAPAPAVARGDRRRTVRAGAARPHRLTVRTPAAAPATGGGRPAAARPAAPARPHGTASAPRPHPGAGRAPDPGASGSAHATGGSATASTPAPASPTAPAHAAISSSPATSAPPGPAPPAEAPPSGEVAVTVPATPVTPAVPVAVSVPDPAPAVQAAGSAAGHVASTVTSAAAPVVAATQQTVGGVLPHHP